MCPGPNKPLRHIWCFTHKRPTGRAQAQALPPERKRYTPFALSPATRSSPHNCHFREVSRRPESCESQIARILLQALLAQELAVDGARYFGRPAYDRHAPWPPETVATHMMRPACALASSSVSATPGTLTAGQVWHASREAGHLWSPDLVCTRAQSSRPRFRRSHCFQRIRHPLQRVFGLCRVTLRLKCCEAGKWQTLHKPLMYSILGRSRA